MNAEQPGRSRVAQVRGHRLVREDHRFFHERGRVGLATQVHPRGPPLGIEANASLHRVEVEPARALARRLPRLRDAGELPQPPSDILLKARRLGGADGTDADVPKRLGGIGAREHPPRLVVGEPRIGADERRVQLEGHEPRRLVQVEVERHRAAHRAGPKRAQVARKLLGQHRDHAVRQVHARRPPPRIHIERGAPRHVVRHVGDVHPEPPPHRRGRAPLHEPHAGRRPSPARWLPRRVGEDARLFRMRADGKHARRLAAFRSDGIQRYRVVEIPRIDRIDGEREALPQIAVPFGQGAARIELSRARLGKRTLGERRLQLVARDDHVDGSARLVGAAKHLLHDAGGCGVARRERRDAHAHERSVLDVGIVCAHGEHVVGNARILGHDHAERVGHLVAPYEHIVRTVENAHDARGRTLLRASAPRSRAAVRARPAPSKTPIRQRRQLHEIAVERARHSRFGNEERALGRLNEAEAARAH